MVAQHLELGPQRTGSFPVAAGAVTGYWRVAAAAVPTAVFGFAVSRSFRARFEATYLLLSDAQRLGANLRAAPPGFRAAAGWALLAIVALAAAGAILQSGG